MTLGRDDMWTGFARFAIPDQVMAIGWAHFYTGSALCAAAAGRCRKCTSDDPACQLDQNGYGHMCCACLWADGPIV